MKIYKHFLCFVAICFAIWSCKDFKIKPDFKKGFIKYYGGSLLDKVAEVQVTSDGGYVIVGTTGLSSNGSSDLFVVKTDMEGNAIWEKRYGGLGADSGSSIKQTADNGYIVLGTYQIDSSKTAMYLVRLNAEGDTLWTKKIGTNTTGSEVQIASQGGFYMIGNVNLIGLTKIFFYKTDINGNKTLQTDSYGYNENNTSGTSVVEESDSIFTWIGNTPFSPILARNRPSGTGNIFAYLKDESFINQSSIINYSDLKKTSDNGYVLTGSSIKDNVSKAIAIKFTSELKESPTMSWYQVYGGASNESSNAIAQTDDGGYIICGYTQSFGEGGKDIYLLKMDNQGNQQWYKTFGGSADDEGISVTQTKDKGYIIAANLTLITTPTNNTVLCLIKTDAQGNITN